MHRPAAPRSGSHCGWIGDAEFARALNFCMLLPGPEVGQLVIWLGWRWLGIAGGLVAGLCFLRPASVLLAPLSFGYALYGTLGPVVGLAAFRARAGGRGGGGTRHEHAALAGGARGRRGSTCSSPRSRWSASAVRTRCCRT